MTEGRVRTMLGLSLIASHFGLVLLVLTLFLANGFLFEEMTTTLALIVPMFASYTTSIVRYVIKHRHASAGQKMVTLDFILIAFSIPALFLICLAGTIIAKAYNVAFQNFEQFKTLLAVIESLFAVYVGYFITELFEHAQDKRAPTKPTV